MLPLNHRLLRASVVVYLHKMAFLFAPAVTQITSELCSVNHKAPVSQSMSAFSCTFIGYLFMKLSSSSIEQFPKRDASEAATRKIFKIKEFAETLLFVSHQCKFWPNFTEIRQFYIPYKFI